MTPEDEPGQSAPERAAERAAETSRALLARVGTLILRVVRERLGYPPPASDLGLPNDAILALTSTTEITLYRLLRHDPPGPSDFEAKAVRRAPRLDAEWPVLYAGLSMFRTQAQALSRAKRSPKIVAEVRLAGPNVHVAKTVGKGHYTVWGDPRELADAATVVFHDE